MSKIISFQLNASSINTAIKEIKEYQKDIEKKSKELRHEIAEELKKEIEKIVRSSMVDDLVDGGYKTPNVTVSYRDHGENTTVVAAIGSDIVWIEFGAGVHYNGGVGTKPNPYANEVPGIVGIGEYGQGRGAQDKWVFSDGDGSHWTYGTKATMPMYNATKNVLRNIEDIARRVFSK